MLAAPETIVERLAQWRVGEAAAPWEIILMPTNRCNQRCKMCWQRWIEEDDGQLDYGEVPEERLFKLVDESAEAGVKVWTITGGGEPLTRRDLVMKLCERIKAHGMSGRLHTNAMMFRPKDLETLVEIGWDRVSISLDGPDAESNNEIRDKLAFERATKAMTQFADLRRQHDTTKPVVCMHTVITNTNFDKLDAMAQLACDFECTGGLFFSSLVVHDESSKQFLLNETQQSELPTHLERAANVADRLGIEHNVEGLGPAGNIDCRTPNCADRESLFNGSTCFEAFLNMAVLPDGRVGPCCTFWEEHADMIHDLSLEEIWLGPYMQNVRKSLLAHEDLPSYCPSCHSHIPVRTAHFREELEFYTYWKSYAEMNLRQRAGYLAGRVVGGLRRRGVRGTLSTVRNWKARQKHWAETQR